MVETSYTQLYGGFDWTSGGPQWEGRGLTGVQLEHELDRIVVEVAAVLDDLDERGQAALARGHLGYGDGCVELPENCTQEGREEGCESGEPEMQAPRTGAGPEPCLMTSSQQPGQGV